MDGKAILKKLRNYSIIIICIVAVVLVFNFHHFENKDTVPYNEYPEGSMLVAKSTYVYPYKTNIAVYKNGTVKRSKIVDEITDMGKPKEHYEKIDTLTSEQINTLKELIKDCEDHRTANLDIQFYGLLIKTSSQSTLESAAHFEQAYVDKLNDFIESLGEDNK